MSREEFLAGLIGLAIMIGMRLLDYWFPKGHHFKFMDKFIIENEDDKDDKQTEET